MDLLVNSDIKATIIRILQLFRSKLKKKVNEVVHNKYGYDITSEELWKKYKTINEKSKPKNKRKIRLKTLIDLINAESDLYMSPTNPCNILHYQQY